MNPGFVHLRVSKKSGALIYHIDPKYYGSYCQDTHKKDPNLWKEPPESMPLGLDLAS